MKETIISLLEAKERMYKRSAKIFKASWILWGILNVLIIFIALSKCVPKVDVFTMLIVSAILGAVNVALKFRQEKNAKVYDKYIIVGVNNYIGQILRQAKMSIGVDDIVQNLESVSCLEIAISLSQFNKEEYLKALPMLTKKFKEEFSTYSIKVWFV